MIQCPIVPDLACLNGLWMSGCQNTGLKEISFMLPLVMKSYSRSIVTGHSSLLLRKLTTTLASYGMLHKNVCETDATIRDTFLK